MAVATGYLSVVTHKMQEMRPSLLFTLTNILGFFSWTEFGPSILGEQYTLMDFLSRENSSVNSCNNKGQNVTDDEIIPEKIRLLLTETFIKNKKM